MNCGINLSISRSFYYIFYLKRIDEGLRMLFVPVQNGVYVPLMARDIKKMNKNENFLDLECLDLKSKDYLK